jgi:hypothetical protein
MGGGMEYLYEYVVAQDNKVGYQPALIVDNGTDSGVYSTSNMSAAHSFYSIMWNGLLAGTARRAFRQAGAPAPGDAGNLSDSFNAAQALVCTLGGGLEGWGFSGTITQLILYPVSEDATNTPKLEGWYAHKYNLTSQLPANHPYKTAPPMK